MSNLAPEHITGDSSNSGEFSAPKISKKNDLVFNKKRNREPKDDHATYTHSPLTSSDDELTTSPSASVRKGKKKVSFSSDPDRDAGDRRLYSLPHQNLDASLHAPYYSPSPLHFPYYGNMPYPPHYYPPP